MTQSLADKFSGTERALISPKKLVRHRLSHNYSSAALHAMKYLRPHTDEWFSALQSCDSKQAAMTKQIISLAGRGEVCSVCGDEPALDYQVPGSQFSPDIGATIRLCDDCREIRRSSMVESFIRF